MAEEWLTSGMAEPRNLNDGARDLSLWFWVFLYFILRQPFLLELQKCHLYSTAFITVCLSAWRFIWSQFQPVWHAFTLGDWDELWGPLESESLWPGALVFVAHTWVLGQGEGPLGGCARQYKDGSSQEIRRQLQAERGEASQCVSCRWPPRWSSFEPFVGFSNCIHLVLISYKCKNEVGWFSV